MSEHAIREYLKTIGSGCGGVSEETDPVFTASPAHGISAQDIADWNDKQDELVSGTNIKTINGTSILGSGDLPVAPPVTSTDVPTADTISEFDSDAHMNSTDMTTGSGSELEDFIDGLNVSGGSAFLDMFYPVGSYYETSDSTFDPNVKWGGTWVLETAGQVHVSAGTGYSISGALTNASDGGSKDAVVVSHHHLVSSGWQTASGQSDKITYGAVNGGYNNNGYGNVQFIQDTGVSGTDKNMPPYIVVCRWHRTA